MYHKSVFFDCIRTEDFFFLSEHFLENLNRKRRNKDLEIFKNKLHGLIELNLLYLNPFLQVKNLPFSRLFFLIQSCLFSKITFVKFILQELKSKL